MVNSLAVNTISNARYSVSLRDEGYYELNIFADVSITIEDVKNIVDMQRRLGGKRLMNLAVSNANSLINIDAVTYLAKNENFPYSKGGAYVVSTISEKLLTNLYKKINGPERPSRFFHTREEAVKWILEVKDTFE